MHSNALGHIKFYEHSEQVFSSLPVTIQRFSTESFVWKSIQPAKAILKQCQGYTNYTLSHVASSLQKARGDMIVDRILSQTVEIARTAKSYDFIYNFYLLTNILDVISAKFRGTIHGSVSLPHLGEAIESLSARLWKRH